MISARHAWDEPHSGSGFSGYWDSEWITPGRGEGEEETQYERDEDNFSV